MKAVICAHPDFSGFKAESSGLLKYRDLSCYDHYEIGGVPELRAQASNIVELYEAIAESHLSGRSATRFVDNIHGDRIRFWYLTKYFPAAKVIVMVRDVRDAYRSFKDAGYPGWGRGYDEAVCRARYCAYWNRYIRLVRKYEELENMLIVQYENLTSNPRKMVKRAMRFLSSSFVEKQIDPDVYSETTDLSDRRNYHVRLKRPITNKSVGRWRQELGERAVDDIESRCRDGLVWAGYT